MVLVVPVLVMSLSITFSFSFLFNNSSSSSFPLHLSVLVKACGVCDLIMWDNVGHNRGTATRAWGEGPEPEWFPAQFRRETKPWRILWGAGCGLGDGNNDNNNNTNNNNNNF